MKNEQVPMAAQQQDVRPAKREWTMDEVRTIVRDAVKHAQDNRVQFPWDLPRTEHHEPTLDFNFVEWNQLVMDVQERCVKQGAWFHPLRSPVRMLRENAIGTAFQRTKTIDVAIEDIEQALAELLQPTKRKA